MKEEYVSEGERVFVFGNNEMRLSYMNTEARQRLREMFGRRFVEDCQSISCPAQYVGYEPGGKDASLTIANVYDRLVRQRYRDGRYDRVDSEDILREPDVKEAWLDAIRFIEFAEENDVDRSHVKCGYYYDEDNLDVAYDIARELGWLGEDETLDPVYPSDVEIIRLSRKELYGL